MIPRPSQILGYLADVAPTGPAHPLRMRIGVEQTEHFEPGSVDVRPLPEGSLGVRHRNLRKLVAADRLHRHERLMRLGWLTLYGEDERGGEMLLPLVEVQVSVEGEGPTWRIHLDGDPRFPQALVDDAVADDLEALVERWREPGFLAGAHLDPDVNAVVGRALDALGVSRQPVVGPDVHPLIPYQHPDGGVSVGMMAYLARDPMALDVAATLRRWANEDLAGTALAALYEPGAAAAVSDDEAIASPLPLNRQQRRAVGLARTHPITVVSGPPGTGKSHLVAAMAIDAIDRGRSVLVATQSEHAADVIGGLFDRVPGVDALRFGNPRYRHAAARDLAQGAPPRAVRPKDAARILEDATRRLEDLRRGIEGTLEDEARFERALETRERRPAAVADAPGVAAEDFDLERAERLLGKAGSARGIFSAWRRRSALRRLLRMVEAEPGVSLDEVDAALEAARAEATIRGALRRGGVTLGDRWHDLVAAEGAWREAAGGALGARRLEARRRNSQAVTGLATALRSGRRRRRRALARIEAADLVAALPLWLGTLADIDDDLPIRSGLFDVVILDEASQIDQGRAATALTRAQRAIVVGDPQQLRHVSFTSDDRMMEAAESAGIEPSLGVTLDVRRNSLFDAAAASAPVLRLEEHFRSVPHIIGFSDRRFYDGGLRLMTQHPSTETRDAIAVISVPGSRVDRVNRPQVDAAITRVRAAMARSGSIGVVTPFRPQADAIEAAALEEFGADEIDRFDLMVGTVHAFQGAERDTVIVATAVAADDATGMRFLEDPNLFNVMVTRARRRVELLLSSAPEDYPQGLLRAYLRHASRPPTAPTPADAPPGWVGAVVRSLIPFGQRVSPGYRVAGWNVDLAVGDGADAIGVEVRTHPDGASVHVERHLALRRAGWSMDDAFQSAHLADPDGAATKVMETVLARQRTSEGGNGR